MSDMPGRMRVRVACKEQIALDIVSFDLISADGSMLPAFSAGSHIDVEAPGGLTRQYSLCNDPEESHRYQIAVLKEANGRGGSKAMHESVHVGSEILISAPRNSFPLVHDAQESILVAGGIGITPLLSMAEKLAALERPLELHYCTRSIQRTAFRERIQSSRFASRACFHVDNDAPRHKRQSDALPGRWRNGAHLYTCGPKGFMDAILSTARSNGWPEEYLHYEFFNAVPRDLINDDSFELEIASSGQVIRVAANQTAVAALAAHGVVVPTSCEQGVCGTCLTHVRAGEPDHRDAFLTPEEQATNDRFLPCCSRAKSERLTLDL